ncbi:MAG: hypothetical protein Q9163_001012 [Psora crenata]
MMFGNKIQFDPKIDIPDLTGKVVLVTGGNNGLGLESCLQLAKHNAHVYLAARTPSKAEAAIEKIKSEVAHANITFLELDLASLASVKSAADRFTAAEPRLHVLLNNAGIMALPPALTQDGYEIQFGTNHLGHALLTKLLLPTLQRTAASGDPNADNDVRIVHVSSAGYELAPRNGGLVLKDVTTDMRTYNTWTRYGQSKLANILFAKALARRYTDSHHIKSIVVHPGAVYTGLSLGFETMHPWLWAVVKPFIMLSNVLSNLDQGTLNHLFAATSPKAKSGCYYTPGPKETVPNKYAQDEKLAKELWEWTECELERHGY